jgi:hypothetical protein
LIAKGHQLIDFGDYALPIPYSGFLGWETL